MESVIYRIETTTPERREARELMNGKSNFEAKSVSLGKICSKKFIIKIISIMPLQCDKHEVRRVRKRDASKNEQSYW